MKRLQHKQRKLMALILVPLSFTFICYLAIFLLLGPIIDPILSVYNLISSDYDVNSEESNDLYANKLIASATIKASDIVQPRYGDVIGKLSVQSVGINVNLYYGDGNLQLKNGVGIFTGSFLPGFNRTTLIAGHAIPYFNSLNNVKTGDIIKVSTHYGDYEYKITLAKVGQVTDESNVDLLQTTKEELVLYTCYSFNLVGYNPQRLFIYADKISGPTILEGQ